MKFVEGYVIGSLRNPKVPVYTQQLRDMNDALILFDDWYAAGPEADEKWQAYEQARGRAFDLALMCHNAKHVFHYDLEHLDRAQFGVMIAPSGKSGHTEMGYLIGQGKPVWILMEEEPERWDVMYCFAKGVVRDVATLDRRIRKEFDL